jgi:LPS-assembly lipoprotein
MMSAMKNIRNVVGWVQHSATHQLSCRHYDGFRCAAPILRGFACVALLTLTACGFHPLFASSENYGGNADPALAQVQIANIPDREGQELRNLLIDKMQHAGRPTDPKYDLVVTLQKNQSDMGIRTDATSARSQLSVTARYVLTAHATGIAPTPVQQPVVTTVTPSEAGKVAVIEPAKELLNSYATTTVGFNKLDAQYSNLAAEEDASRRALSELSDQIVSRLSLYFGAAEK